MAYDVSYFKLQGENTEYSFNDLDAEARITLLASNLAAEETRAETAEQANAAAVVAESTRAQGVEGDLDDLTTTADTSLVAAINELVTSLGTKAEASALSALVSSLAPTGATYTLNGVTYIFRKMGRIVNVISSGTCTAAMPMSTYTGGIVQVASAYYPLTGTVINAQATNTTAAQFNLSGAGELQVGWPGSEIPAGSTIRMSVTYISAT